MEIYLSKGFIINRRSITADKNANMEDMDVYLCEKLCIGIMFVLK